MTDSTVSTKEVGKHFSDHWYKDKSDWASINAYQDLMRQFEDSDHFPKSEIHEIIRRAYVACEYVLNHVPVGGRVLDMACGTGYITHCLTSKGYAVEGFDISEKAIELAKSNALILDQNPENFFIADQRILETMDDDSLDAILAIGYFRYLSKEEHDYCYRQVARILKPGGKFIIIHQNILFEIFAMNSGTLEFWADTINEFSNVESLLDGQKVIDVLQESVTVPDRQYDQTLTTKRILNPVSENPLTFSDTAESYGFHLEKIRCPNSHLLPPLMEAKLDKDKLKALKHEVSPNKADDWRSLFMDYEFIAFLELK